MEANQLSIDCIKSLKDASWIESGHMTEDNLKRFLEFFFYLFHIPEKTRRSSLTLNFKPGSKVIDFVSELEVKIQEHAHTSDLKSTSSIVAPIQTTSTSKPSPTCWFCKQPGHVESHCPRRKDSPKNKEGAHKKFTDQQNRYARNNYSAQHPRPLYCHIHGWGSHETERCFTVKKVKDEHKLNQVNKSKTQSNSNNSKA